MASLVPAVGAHYHYCYSTICEIIGFMVGWNLLLAYSAITISKCSSLSRFIDHVLFGDWVAKTLQYGDVKGMYFFCLNGFVDIITPLLTITMACQTALAVKTTKRIFNIFTVITMVVIVILIIIFGMRLDFHNFEIADTDDSEKLYDIFVTTHSALIGYESLGVLGIIGTFITVEYDISFFSLTLATVMTCACLLITRYRCETGRRGTIILDEQDRWVLFNYPSSKKEPTDVTHCISMLLIYNAITSAATSVLCTAIIYSLGNYQQTSKFKIIGIFSIISCIVFTNLLKQQPSNNRTNLTYSMLGVPVIPVLTILAELLSALVLCKEMTIFGVLLWSTIGAVYYFSYSIHHSEESRHLHSDGTRWNPMENPHTLQKDSLFSMKEKMLLMTQESDSCILDPQPEDLQLQPHETEPAELEELDHKPGP